ncbi:MAG: hypothetical protein HRU05_09290 [Oceanospirillaceae bacterium]|nr:hypothetical protein [Oceanospirillaceae bacterium]
MKDIHKGIILLCMALLASIISFSVDDRHWNMPFVSFAEDSHRDVADLQAQLLAGLDPTENSAPTAAGNQSNDLQTSCLSGKIARDKTTDKLHDDSYISVKESSAVYIQIILKQVLLVKGPFETQSASVIDVFPNTVSERLELASNSGNCTQIDLYLSKIKGS